MPLRSDTPTKKQEQVLRLITILRADGGRPRVGDLAFELGKCVSNVGNLVARLRAGGYVYYVKTPRGEGHMYLAPTMRGLRWIGLLGGGSHER